MKINQFDTNKNILIVAEIGNNHEGRIEVAQKLIHKAKEAGVDAVKFQTFETEHYVNKSDKDRFARLKSFELSASQFKELSQLSKSLGLLFISTPFDLNSVDVLAPLVDAYKISSGDLPFTSLVKKVCEKNKPVILSTGASDIPMIDQTLNEVNIDPSNMALLHCVSSYPVPKDQTNLGAIPYLKEKYPHSIGYSDHTQGIDAAILAVSFGARIIEKHFTLDKNYSDFRDHQLSSDSKEMEELVKQIRQLESQIGPYHKKIQDCEMDAVVALRRSIVSTRELSKGMILSSADITWTRPAGGIRPGEEKKLLGKKLVNSVPAGHRFQESDVE